MMLNLFEHDTSSITLATLQSPGHVALGFQPRANLRQVSPTPKVDLTTLGTEQGSLKRNSTTCALCASPGTDPGNDSLSYSMLIF